MAATRDHSGPPPASTRLSIGDDIAWSELSGVYDRDDSLKENTNPKCLLKNHHPAGRNGNGSSQRFSGNLKPTAAPIIGISGNFGQGGGPRRNHHHHHHHHHHHQQYPPAMFPKKAKTGGGGRNPRPAVPEREPSSPKVSCIGKVLPDRERARRRQTSPAETKRRPPGCCPGFGLLVRRSRSRRSAVESIDWSPPPRPPAAAAARRKEVRAEEETPAPALGGMMRFASGRRGPDWAAEMEVDDRVAKSGPL